MIKSGFKKRPFLWAMIAIAVVHILISFTVIPFNDAMIPIFSFERIVDRESYMARVLGSHVLETEYGEIRLGHFSRILVAGGSIGIGAENFENGHATHNLVIKGIVVPPYVRISFGIHPQIGILTLYRQEIILAGVPLTGDVFSLNPLRSTANIMINFLPPDYITLADTTQIYFDPLRQDRTNAGLKVLVSSV
jgi:hypothetical protein